MKSNLIQKAILSEKAYAQMEQGIYTFVVSAASAKADVKKAVENQFLTKVTKVRLLAFPSKTKRVTGTRKTTQVGGGKKAIVILEKGQKIAMLSPKAETKKQNYKETRKKDQQESAGASKGFLSKIRKSKKDEQKKEEINHDK